MVYDCFIFNNELDLLELRLNYLDSSVDFFVIVESTKTFTGNFKRLNYKENAHRFQEYHYKIRHVIVDDDIFTDNPWDRESFQRNCISRGLYDTSTRDLVMISDLDEIPNMTSIFGSHNEQTSVCEQALFYYALNNLNITQPLWLGTVVTNGHMADRLTPQQLRAKARNSEFRVIENGGWHFSYVGDFSFIKNKIEANSHQEYNVEKYTSQSSIEKSIKSGEDLFGRGFAYRAVRYDADMPFRDVAQLPRSLRPYVFEGAKYELSFFVNKFKKKEKIKNVLKKFWVVSFLVSVKNRLIGHSS